MADKSEELDFSGLFKLDTIVQAGIKNYAFYELGLKKFLAFSCAKELIFVFINQSSERVEKNYDWDFLDNPVHCICFEPSGTWVLVVSDQKVLLVPFLPLFSPQDTFDHRWSHTGVTVLPLGNIPKVTSVVWWLTKESDNVIIIGSKTGAVFFYSLESQCIVGESKISGEVVDLQICFDDSLDLITLLISSSKSQQWKLVLEHRSFGYNWLQQSRSQTDLSKRESFMSFIKQLSKDKITLLMQGGSKDESKSQTVEHSLKPTEYLPQFRKGSNNWALTAQYVNGRHFLTAFELNEGTLILESPDEDNPSRTLRPKINKDVQYIQGFWSKRLIYLLRKNRLEIHSAKFSVILGEGTKRDTEQTQLWSAELIGDIKGGHLMSKPNPNLSMPATKGWRKPTFMCDLMLPRFKLEPCLIVTTCGAYLFDIVSDPAEWLVGKAMRGSHDMVPLSEALGASVRAMLPAAADMQLSRGNVQIARFFYHTSQMSEDGWLARLGVFGLLHNLATYNEPGKNEGLGNAAIAIKLLALFLEMSTHPEEKIDINVKYTTLSTVHLVELASIAASIGLWDLIPSLTLYLGQPHLLLSAMKTRNLLCRGALYCLLKHTCLVTLLLEENGQWIFDFVLENCENLDTVILKRLCLWMNPLQDQLRPVMRDLKQGIKNIYTTRLVQLISTFARVASTIESREPCPEIHREITQSSETWKSQFVPKRAISCGLAHWAIADEGNGKVLMTDTEVNTNVIGRVVDVACGRHHTLVLTENGIYAAGDNMYGQLGIGSQWPGDIGDSTRTSGALLHVPYEWTAPLLTVSAGHYHSAAVDVGGRLYTWGWGVHGQLGLGSIDDHCTPQLVTKLLGRKVVSVGCGTCHTTVLMKNGEVWVFGAGVFGQLGNGGREKSSLPIKVPLNETIEKIAVGYFHNLALSTKGELFTWGSSPQLVRAMHARRSAGTDVSGDQISPRDNSQTHLSPLPVDVKNVRGRIVQISAGWHHSCLVTISGSLYCWGLNFDGQLGSGDRKLLVIPIRVNVRDPQEEERIVNGSDDSEQRKVLVACGGDFTVVVDEDGKIYATGNKHLQAGLQPKLETMKSDENLESEETAERHEGEKNSDRLVKIKTTKRMLSILASRIHKKFTFQQVDRVDIMFPFDIEAAYRKSIQPSLSPLATMQDFDKKSWADDLIILLKPWLNEEFESNFNMAAKLAYHNKSYTECLRLLLDNLKCDPKEDKLYLTHTKIDESGKITDEKRAAISINMSKRIKNISMAILNEKPYPDIDQSTYKSFPCVCDELKYVPQSLSKSVVNITEKCLSIRAAEIIDKCISIFPVDSSLWENCFRLSKDYYLENKLCVEDLETVLRKYMESNATTMAAAIMYSKDCAQYNEILSAKFYLNMCSRVLDTWG